MKRLLCIVSSLDVGGAETFLMKVFRFLSCDYKFDFIVSKENGFYEQEVQSLGGRIFRIPLRTKKPIKAFFSLYKIVKDNQYTCVLKLSDTPIAFFDLLAAKLGGASKLCVRSCNASSNEGLFRKLANFILRPLLNFIADVEIAPSTLAAEYTFGKTQVKNNRILYLHNAVDLTQFSYVESSRKVLRESFNIAEDDFVIGHVGRFSPQKNHSFLIDVFFEFHKKNSKSKLILVGDGELRQSIENRVLSLNLKDSVIFTGVRSDVPQFLSAFDLLLLPSYFEGMPNVVIEAQAAGLSCVISDTITREADITGMVTYLDIKQSPAIWAEFMMSMKVERKIDSSANFIEKGYDISSLSKVFKTALLE